MKRSTMEPQTLSGGIFKLAEDLSVHRMGYGAMQLTGPGVFGPPKDRMTPHSPYYTKP